MFDTKEQKEKERLKLKLEPKYGSLVLGGSRWAPESVWRTPSPFSKAFTSEGNQKMVRGSPFSIPLWCARTYVRARRPNSTVMLHEVANVVEALMRRLKVKGIKPGRRDSGPLPAGVGSEGKGETAGMSRNSE